MPVILKNFNKAKAIFLSEREKEDGSEVMQKITILVNELGQEFSALNGGELAEIKMKLAGYKFYLAEYISDLNQISEALKLELKEIKAMRWDEVMEVIKAEKGKVSNKEQIENIIIIEQMDTAHKQILYENLYYKYKLKLSAIDDILTALVQQIASKKRELEQGGM